MIEVSATLFGGAGATLEPSTIVRDWLGRAVRADAIPVRSYVWHDCGILLGRRTK